MPLQRLNKTKLIPKCSFLLLQFDHMSCQNNRTGEKVKISEKGKNERKISKQTQPLKSETEATNFKGKC